MDEQSSLFFVDLGEDRDPAYIKLSVRLFDYKEAQLKIHTKEGDIITTGLIVDYYVPKESGEELFITPQNCPIAPNCKKEHQLFIFNAATGEQFQNSEAIKRIFEESALYEAYEVIGGNTFKILICESRYLGIEPNRWTVFMPSRVVDKLVLIQRGLLGLLK